ncbi:MAG TPA: hypothetical protein VKV17_11685 [Bryobacteraceae bacterium]|nr:hypothetical protein [Bryobacteraceae bacterium]
MALCNFAFLIRPQSEAAYNPALVFASAQQSRWPPGTPILFHTFHPDLWTISYFTQEASWIVLNEASEPELEHWLQYARCFSMFIANETPSQ